MKGEREVKNGVSEEEREVKRKRVMERSDSPPPPLGFNNPLLPFANAYDDDNNQQNKSQTRCNVVAKGEGNGNKVKGEAQVEVDDDEDDDDDASKGRGKHSRHVEVRRDCPYLDTVNRQVYH
jgi:U4/U6.U5 tri-snRNP-associated protein 2